MKKYFAMVFMALATFSLFSCGDEEEETNVPGQQEQNQQGQQEHPSKLLSGTKWFGTLRCQELVDILEYTPSGSLTHHEELLDCIDTIYYDFGVDVDYPTYTKITHKAEDNRRLNTIDMWFDYTVTGNVLDISFRSFPPGDEGKRQIIYVDKDRILSSEHGVEYELKRIK